MARRDDPIRRALNARAGIEAFSVVIATMERAPVHSEIGKRRVAEIIKAARAGSQAELRAMDAAMLAAAPDPAP